MIVLEHVSKSYGQKKALAPLSLCIKAGEIVALVGPNGAGKSTTIGITTGQVIADSGTVRLGGRDLGADPIGARQALGYLPQETLLPRHLTASELVRFVADVRGASHESLDALLALAVEEGDRERVIGELSTGTQRKVALSASLVGNPAALVVDEPFAGLDVCATARFEQELRHRSQQGAAVFLSSHDLTGVARLCTRVVVLRAGTVVEELSRADIDESALSALLSA